MEKNIKRILLTKAEHDCHDRGVRYIAMKLREDGFEVIYTNFLYPEEVLNTAIQEDVDVVGLSSSSLGHMPVLRYVKEGLKKEGRDDILVVLGGIIPDDDLESLEALGITGIFGPGTTSEQLVRYIEESAA